ncbi:MAG: EF-hand domain-containing protein [Lysobacter sp.]|nr:EF-hand domain-containing protein [Lysobacter sp.]
MIMKQSRNALMGLLALSVAVAMPMAFAQKQDQKAADPAATTQSETPATTTPAPAAPTATAGDAKPKTWSDVDGDKDGNISKTEAASEPAVGEIFDLADANKDSKLTPDEYKAYVAKANGAAKPAGQGG